MKIKIDGCAGDTGCSGFTVGHTDYAVNVKLHDYDESRGGYRWVVRIKRTDGDGRALSFKYYTGRGCPTDEFDFADFANCLQSDFSAVEGCDDWRDFAREFGYDDVEGRRVFAACEDQRMKLRRLFGSFRLNRFFELYRLDD